MLVGPGGVVAVVLGGWSVLWAVRRAPGRPWSVLLPAIGAFAAAMTALPLLTAHAESVTGLLQWIRAEPEERDLLRLQLSSYPWRPLVGSGIALATMGAAVVWARGRPDPAPPGRRLHLLEVLALIGVAGCAVGALITLGLLGAVLNQSTSGPAAALGHLTRIQNLARIGTLFAGAELLLGGLLALGRLLRP